ncbi:hypothetical protein P4O66_006872 [Electrophorus voltai]|uniref:ribonuclease H n=1 Tax=Electrophorus voltai TaxID=2609070 RepID=A0AAD8ZJB1_9TELE|nr:hypothetical protein P4O66_006872 [Electrophorus voltai]
MGHYEYLVLPYGLATAPLIFQAYIKEVLREFLGRSVVAYIEDILIYSSSWNQHVCDVRAVLQTLLGNHLYCKAENCKFHRKEVDFLGYAIQQGCVGMQPGKVEAVKAWPRPLTHKALHRFLGFTNFYRRFIRSFSSLARPLTDQLRGPVKKIKWIQEFNKAFEELKNAFATAPVLQQLDPERPFVLEVWKKLLGKLNITVNLTSDYHPQANGQVERVNQELGYQPPLYPWNIPTSDKPEVDRWCWESERTWEETHQNLRRVIAVYKRKADKKRGETPKYEIGQKVWVSTRDGRAGATGKLETRYEGPYSITGWVNEVTYRVGLTGSSWASWAFHVSSLKPVREGSFAEEGDSPEVPPLPLVMEDGPAYRVRSLLDSHRRGWGLKYLVDWEGYGPEERCWVPASQVLDLDLIASFHRWCPLRPAPSQRAKSRSGPLGGGGSVMVDRYPKGGDTLLLDQDRVTHFPHSQSPVF